jgi:hypothetical protein
MITAESRDFNVATYSVASLIGIARASSTFTGIALGPLACAFCEALLEQPSITPVTTKAATSRLFVLAKGPCKVFTMKNAGDHCRFPAGPAQTASLAPMIKTSR